MGKNQFWAGKEEGNPDKYLSVFYPTRVEILMFASLNSGKLIFEALFHQRSFDAAVFVCCEMFSNV